MRYENQKCPVCGEAFTENDDIVVCPECATPHHRACFENLNHCANEHLHNEDFVWKSEEKPSEPKEVKTEEAEQKNETVICPNCHSELSKRQLVCNHCGAIIHPEIEKEFSPPEVYIDGKPVDNNDFIDSEQTVKVKEAACFIGQNKENYIKSFLDAKINKRRAKFNFSALIFGEFWFFFRKIYKVGLVFAGISIALYCFISAFMFRALPEFYQYIIKNAEAFATYTADEEMMSIATELMIKGFTENTLPIIGVFVVLILFVIKNIVAGFIANDLYLKHIKKTIGKLKSFVAHERAYYTYLYAKGGTTILNTFAIGMALYLAMQYILSFALM